MSDELTLKVGRRGAQLLLRKLVTVTLATYGEDRRFLESLCYQLKDFIDRPPPRYVEMEYKVIAVGGVPVDEEKHGD